MASILLQHLKDLLSNYFTDFNDESLDVSVRVMVEFHLFSSLIGELTFRAGGAHELSNVLFS